MPIEQKNANILIVDDNLSNLNILFTMLSHQGHEVRGASNGSAALMMINSEPPDLILLDVSMPDMDGYTVCQQVKENPKTARIPVIFISGANDSTDKVRGFEIGGVDYITKPFKIQEVMMRIQLHLDLYNLQSQVDAQNIQLQQEINEHKRTETKLQELNEKLENRVVARTAELTSANNTLQEEIVERHQAEEALRTSEAVYRSLVNNLDIGVTLVDENMKVVMTNPAQSQIIKIDNIELPTKYCYSHSIQSDTPCPTCPGRKALTTRKPEEVERKGIRPDGSQFWARIKAIPLPSQNHQSTGYIELVEDITQRKQAEEELRESEAKFHSFYDNSPDMLVSVSAEDATILLCNETLLQKTGYTKEEVIGTPIYKMYHDDCLPNAKKAFYRFLETGKLQNEELILKRKDGSKIEVILNVNSIRDEAGNVSYSLSSWRDISDRKKVELALQKSQQNLVTAQSIAHIGSWEWDVQNNSVFWSDEMYRIFGFDLGITPTLEMVENILHPDDAEHYKEEMINLVTGQDSFPIEYRIIRSDGGVRTIFAHSEITYDTNNYVRVVGTMQDITESRKVDATLRQLSRAVEQSPVSIVITDTKGIMQYVNPWFCKVTGYSADEVIGENPRVLKSGHTTNSEYKTLWEIIKSGGTWRGEFHNKKKNGDMYWEFASISPILDDTGQITHYLGIKEDITERKIMQAQLQKQNRELQLLNRASRVIGSSLDIDKILVTMLDETRDLLHVLACSVWLLDVETGRLVCEQVTGPEADMVRSWGLATEQGVAGWVATHGESLIIPNILEDKRHFKGFEEQTSFAINSMLAVPLQINQNVVGVFQVVDQSINRFTVDDLQLVESLAAVAANAIENAWLHEDLQDQLNLLKEAKARLVQSEKLAAVGELISGIAHELNNPLAATMLYAQLLQTKGVREELHHDLKQIVSQSQRASNVVRGLLDFARQRPPERIATQINDILKSTVELLAYELRTHNIEVFTQLPELPVTMADPHQLQQVFVNLINNGLQAMNSTQENGRLSIYSKMATPRFFQNKSASTSVIRLLLQDNGPGISMENQAHIFDPFFTTKPEGEGTGLGLSVCHGIVSEHGGHMWVESELGNGATFIIELPIIEPIHDEDTPTADMQDTENTASSLNRRILIIDDEVSILKIIVQILRRQGYHVDGRINAQEALDELQLASYDLVICDLRMPEMSGPEFYRNVCQRHPEMAKKFIFSTGDTVSGSTGLFLKQTNLPFLSKPFAMKTLFNIVNEHWRVEENEKIMI